MRQATIEESFEAMKPDKCVFVISVDQSGKPSGMSAAWMMKCSWDPPLIAICLSKKGYTHSLIRQSKEFVLAIPNKSLEKEVIFFGTTHGNEVDKFKESGIKTESARCVKSPLIMDATANFECTVEKEVDAGDHVLFIGKVLASYVNPGKKVLLTMKMKDKQRVLEEF